MFTIYNKVTRGSFIITFFSSFFHLPIIYSSLAISFRKFYLSSSDYLFKSNNYIITIIIVFTVTVIIIIIIIIIVMLTNINVTVIYEKSSGGEFQARNLSGMLYPY